MLSNLVQAMSRVFVSKGRDLTSKSISRTSFAIGGFTQGPTEKHFWIRGHPGQILLTID